jgi:hypothetical protein
VTGVTHLLPDDGTWLRCQLHAHTTNSDGDATPAGLCDHYARAGYDVLAITDHWHVTSHERDGLVVIPSSELSSRCNAAVREAEVLALGVAALPEVRDYFESIEALAAWILAEGGAPYLCHPYWSGIEAEHYLSAPSLVGLEIYNAGCEVAQGNGLSTVHWDNVIQAGTLAFGVATDDCHYLGQDSRHAWTFVSVRERSREAVIAALREGRAYSSTGPEIHAIELDGDAVEVRCAPARTVRMRSGPWDGCSVHADRYLHPWLGEITGRAPDGSITAARFDLPEYWRWGRIEVDGTHGGRAWSNPFALPGEPPAATYFADSPPGA